MGSNPLLVNAGLVGKGRLYALGARTGTLGWSRAHGNGSSSPTLKHGVVHLGAAVRNGDARVEARRTSTGAIIWSFNPGGDVDAAPTVEHHVLYLGSGNGKVYALNAASGAKKWAFQTAGYNSVESTPAVKKGVVYVGAGDSRVYALYGSNGTKRWSYETGGSVSSSPAVGSARVFVGRGTDYCHDVYGINRSSGAKSWTYTTGGPVYSSPALAHGVVYVGSYDDKIMRCELPPGSRCGASPPAA